MSIYRQYVYIITNRKVKLSLDQDRSWLVKKKLDIKKMKKAIKYFVGTHNFSAFRSTSCSAKSPIRTITHAGINSINNNLKYKYKIKA